MKRQTIEDRIWRLSLGVPLGRRIFGGLFFCFGLPPLLGALGVIEVKESASGQAMTGSPLLVLMALVFLAIGLTIATHERGVDVDPRKRTVTRWRRVLFPFGHEVLEAREAREVAFGKGSHGHGRSKRTVYPLDLRGPQHAGSREGQRVLDAATILDAREATEWLARLLQVDAVDETREPPVRRAATDLDLSLREQREAPGAPPAPQLGSPPPRMRSTCRAVGDALTVEIPAIGVTALHVVGLLAALGPIGFVSVAYWIAGGAKEAPALPSIFLFGLGIAPSATMWYAILRHALRRHSLHVSRDELRIYERGLRRRSFKLDTDEIEEIHGPDTAPKSDASLLGGPSAEITVLTDRQRVSLGTGLRKDEASYLRNAIYLEISAPRR